MDFRVLAFDTQTIPTNPLNREAFVGIMVLPILYGYDTHFEYATDENFVLMRVDSLRNARSLPPIHEFLSEHEGVVLSTQAYTCFDRNSALRAQAYRSWHVASIEIEHASFI
jgi:hypothetical protein